MTSGPIPLHSLQGSVAELRTFARFWEWERCIRANLPRVLLERRLTSVFQTVFDLDQGDATPCGYEALARFPIAPRIPVGLWFRLANEVGLGNELERLAASSAVGGYQRLLSADRFLNVNASLNNATDVAGDAAVRVETILVVDIPWASLQRETFMPTVESLRATGVRISLDDTPLDQLHGLRDSIQAVRPDYVKVDVLVGLHDNVMGRFNLAEGAAWCRDSGVGLVAERVERPEDLELLHHLGVEKAQGYSLARPA